eukprot:scaffold5666_cov202-Prasinococcus_capsulatus_cf.AAC.1
MVWGRIEAPLAAGAPPRAAARGGEEKWSLFARGPTSGVAPAQGAPVRKAFSSPHCGVGSSGREVRPRSRPRWRLAPRGCARAENYM